MVLAESAGSQASGKQDIRESPPAPCLLPMSRTVIGHPLQPVAPALVLKEDLAPGLLQDVLLGLDQDGEGAPRAGGALELLVCRANGGAQVVREDLEEELRGERTGRGSQVYPGLSPLCG